MNVEGYLGCNLGLLVEYWGVLMMYWGVTGGCTWRLLMCNNVMLVVEYSMALVLLGIT